MMREFAALLEGLVLTPSRNGKLRLIANHLKTVPDPDRGHAVAAIAGALDLQSIKPAMLRELVAERVDPELFALSYDYVGDLAETIALIWPASSTRHNIEPPTLGEVVETLQGAKRGTALPLIEKWLDVCPTPSRFALLKLVTGGMRVGVSARLIKQALADHGGRDITEIEELWNGLEPPYGALLAWLDGTGPRPENTIDAPFLPVMLAHPLDAAQHQDITPDTFAAEWKWDGIRVQAVRSGGVSRLYTRTGDDISRAFPDLAEALGEDATLDGELLVAQPSPAGPVVGTFSDLQQRLNRKTVTASQLRAYPAFMRLYDVLKLGDADFRDQPYDTRRAALEELAARLDPARFDVSEQIDFASIDDLAASRAAPPLAVIEGLMLKRRASPYLTGRVKGHWFKWKRDPMTVDAVLMYAQRGHGKRSSFYSDFTFGVWVEDDAGHPALVPVGKAYSGFSDDELKRLDRFVRDNTVDRFGPVRAIRADSASGLVVEVAFEGINRSTRHKSGIALRFPRFSRIRWDKPTADADRLETLEALLSDPNSTNRSV